MSELHARTAEIMDTIVVHDKDGSLSAIPSEAFDHFVNALARDGGPKQMFEHLAVMADTLWEKGLFFCSEQLFFLARLGLDQARIDAAIAAAGENRTKRQPSNKSGEALSSTMKAPKALSVGVRPKRS
ncbi:MAG: hypothetical protein IT381_28315 [Deltaproteobacteria bacterium]|nr:hypothetical protein [Deltaproteobacteria bacterium]